VLLPDGHKLWPDWLRKIDTLLEDEAVIEVVAKGLEARWPQSRGRGRPGTPAEVVIRMLISKHLSDCRFGAFGWTFLSGQTMAPRPQPYRDRPDVAIRGRHWRRGPEGWSQN
jgi:hypothetical protein